MRKFKITSEAHIIFLLANAVLREVNAIYPKCVLAYIAAGGIPVKRLETTLRILAQLLPVSIKMT